MSTKASRIYLLKEAKVSSALLKLGIPTMIGMLISALYNVIDGLFVGKLGLSQFGAVSVVFPIVQIVIGLGMMFGAGASSYISRLLGKGEKEQADKTASTTVLMSLIVGAVVITFIMIFLDPILKISGATDTILPYAREYARIYVIGSIINVFTVTMNNLLVAQGASKFTMIAMLLGSIANIALDPIFIFVFNMGISGAAIATVISLCINMVFYIVYIAKKAGVLRFSVKNIKFSKKYFAEVLKIGVPVLVFQLLASVSMQLINSAAKPYGDYAVSAMGAVIRIMTMVTYVVFGFLKGFQAFAGYNYGAQQYDRLKQSIKLCLIWSTVFCVLAALILCIFSKPIIGMFGNDAEMITLGSKALILNAILFITFGFQMVYATLYLAIGKSLIGSLLSLSRQGIFFIPLRFILPLILGLTGIIWIQPAADILTTALTVVFAILFHKKVLSQNKIDQVQDEVENNE